MGGGALICCGATYTGGASPESQRLSNPNIFLQVAVHPVVDRTNPAKAIRTKERFMFSPKAVDFISLDDGVPPENPLAPLGAVDKTVCWLVTSRVDFHQAHRNCRLLERLDYLQKWLPLVT